MKTSRSLQIMKSVKIVLAFVTVMLLFAAVPAKADVIRGLEDGRSLQEIFQITFTKDQDTGKWNAEEIFWNPDSEVGSGFRVETLPTGLSLSAVSVSQTQGILPQGTIGYAASVSADGISIASLDAFLDSVLIVYGTAGSDFLGRPTFVPEGGYYGSTIGTGNYFFDLWEAHLQSGKTIEFDFDNAVGVGNAYTFTFYRETDTSVPEPATLAILGLGFAGLGLVRWRKR